MHAIRDFTGVFSRVLEIWPLLKLKTMFFPPPLWMIFTIFYSINFFLSILVYIASIYRFLTFSPLITITNNTNANLVISSFNSHCRSFLAIRLFPRFDRNTFDRIDVVESGMAKRLRWLHMDASSSHRHFTITGVATVESLTSFSHFRFMKFSWHVSFNI